MQKLNNTLNKYVKEQEKIKFIKFTETNENKNATY